MKVFYKKFHPDAKEPFKKHDDDACYDLVATSIKDHGDGRVEYGLGIGFQCLSPQVKISMKTRSSIHKTGLILSNCIGTGDEGYTGEYKAVFYNVIPSLPNYKIGERVLQIEVESRRDLEFTLVTDFKETSRSNGGFGSTGK